MGQRPKFATIDEYLLTVSPDIRPIMEEIREIVRRAVPAAQETISYQMPAFRLDDTFIYFAAFKKHVGIYPPVKGDEDLEGALRPYRGEKGNRKFPLDQPFPYDLVGRLAQALSGRYQK